MAQKYGARPVDGPSRWDGFEPNGFREGIKMSRDYHGEHWQSRSNGLCLMENRLNAARESGSAGVPPAMTNAGKMPAIHRGIAPKHRRGEKPRERGLRFATGPKPRPGVKRRAEDRLRRRRPVNGPLDWPIPPRVRMTRPESSTGVMLLYRPADSGHALRKGSGRATRTPPAREGRNARSFGIAADAPTREACPPSPACGRGAEGEAG
jgi:hypothetical protein